MKVGVFQFAPIFGNVQANLQKIEETLAHVEADLLVLPELCTTGYQFISSHEVQALAEPVPEGESVQRLCALCKRKGFYLVCGMAEKTKEGIYNSAVLVGPDGWLGTYRKTHLFFEEKLWFVHGNSGFKVWDLGMARIGILICFDWAFPEAARTLALQGADILCHPTNLVLPYCPDAMITRSIENRVYSITCNRVGEEKRNGKPKLNFIGKSEVVGVKGEIYFRMGSHEEGVRIVEIDPLQARDKQIIQGNDLFQDRRPEMYHLN